MGFDVGAALLGGGDFLGSLFGVGAAEAAPVAGDVFAAGAGDALAGGLEGVGLGTAGFGALGEAGGATTAALGTGATLGDLGAGVGLGTAGLGALGGAGGFGAATDLGALGSAGLDLTGVGLGFAPPATGVADAATGLGGVPGTPFGGTTLPNVQPAGLGGGPSAPTVGATQVSDLTTQDLNTTLTGNPITPDTGATKPATWPLAGTQGVTPGAQIAPGATGTGTPGLGGGTPPSSAPPSGGGGGGGGWTTRDWMSAAGLGLAAAPLAITLARGEPSLPPQSGAAQGLYGAEGAAGQQLLQSALTNQPTPGQRAQLDAARQAYINAQRQALYNQGIQNPEASGAWAGIVGQANQQYQQQLQGYIAQNMNAALAATGGAAGGLTQLAGQQINLDTAYQQAIANAGRSLGGFVGQAGTRLL